MEKTISPKRVKMAVYNRIDFELSEEFWEEIDTAFAECWNEVIGYGNDVYKETIVGYIVGYLKRKRIMLSVDKVDRIVGIILDYIKMTGGFLDEDAVVIPVQPKRDKKGRFLKKEEEEMRKKMKSECPVCNKHAPILNNLLVLRDHSLVLLLHHA